MMFWKDFRTTSFQHLKKSMAICLWYVMQQLHPPQFWNPSSLYFLEQHVYYCSKDIYWSFTDSKSMIDIFLVWFHIVSVWSRRPVCTKERLQDRQTMRLLPAENMQLFSPPLFVILCVCYTSNIFMKSFCPSILRYKSKRFHVVYFYLSRCNI